MLILLMGLYLHINAKAQVYNFQSIDGAKIQANLDYKPSSGTLSIACSNDTIYLVDYIDLDKVKVLDDKFLQVSYFKRAGSNEGLVNTLLLCVYHKKLVQSLHIVSFSEYDMRDIYHTNYGFGEYKLFRIKTQLLGTNKDNYKLRLGIHDESKSERNPKTNHNFNKQITLAFDSEQNVFYEKYLNLSGSFSIYNPKYQVEIKESVNSPVLSINIVDKLYYYIKNEWYEKSNNKHLIKYTFK